jgi:hypothetical protein
VSTTRRQFLKISTFATLAATQPYLPMGSPGIEIGAPGRQFAMELSATKQHRHICRGVKDSRSLGRQIHYKGTQ